MMPTREERPRSGRTTIIQEIIQVVQKVRGVPMTVDQIVESLYRNHGISVTPSRVSKSIANHIQSRKTVGDAKIEAGHASNGEKVWRATNARHNPTKRSGQPMTIEDVLNVIEQAGGIAISVEEIVAALAKKGVTHNSVTSVMDLIEDHWLLPPDLELDPTAPFEIVGDGQYRWKVEGMTPAGETVNIEPRKRAAAVTGPRRKVNLTTRGQQILTSLAWVMEEIQAYTEQADATIAELHEKAALLDKMSAQFSKLTAK